MLAVAREASLTPCLHGRAPGGVYVQRVVTLQTAEMVLSAYEKLESSELNTTELSSNLVRMSSPVAASLSLFSFVWVY